MLNSLGATLSLGRKTPLLNQADRVLCNRPLKAVGGTGGCRDGRQGCKSASSMADGQAH